MLNKTLLIHAPALLSTLLIAGCGGGNDAAEPAPASAQSVAPATVQLEGCVVNSEWVGTPDTAVHVRMADGRLVGTTVTNWRGVFVVTIPARSALVLDTDATGRGEIALNTGSGPFSVSACLRKDL